MTISLKQAHHKPTKPKQVLMWTEESQGCGARKAHTQGPELHFGNKEAGSNQERVPSKDQTQGLLQKGEKENSGSMDYLPRTMIGEK